MPRPMIQQPLPENKIYCNYCPGYCCYKLEGSVLLITAEDINRMARYFNISDGQVRKRFLQNKYTFKTREDGSCIFLTNGKLNKRCSIHTARPQQCMDFPHDKACPYLHNEYLLRQIVPKFECSITQGEQSNSKHSPDLTG